MQIINYISSAAIPTVILIIIMYGVIQKFKVYDTFIDGAKEGIEIVFRLFPTLIGIFLAVGALRNSGIIDLIINIISPVTSLLKIPSQVLPLAMLRPISGSASMAVAVDIMQKYGVDTTIGLITSTIMGSIYDSSIYKLCWNKENKVCIICGINGRFSWNNFICNNLANFVVKF